GRFELVMPAEHLIALGGSNQSIIVRFKELRCAFEMLNRSFIAAEVLAGHAEMKPHVKGIRFQAKRFLMRRQSLVIAADSGQDVPLGSMSLGQGWIERERLFGGRSTRVPRPSPEMQ